MSRRFLLLVLVLAALIGGRAVVAGAQPAAPPAQSPTQPPAQSPAPPPTQAPQAPAQAPAQPPAPEQPRLPNAEPGDPFAEEVTMPERTIIYFSGSGLWDSAFDTIQDGFKSVYAYLDKEGIKPSGQPMTIYTATDDSGFQFQAAVPVATAPANPPKGDLAVGKSPTGRALKFIHRGSYDAMDATYEAITNYLDEKSIDAKELFIEQYLTDPLKTAENKLVVEVYVPVK